MKQWIFYLITRSPTIPWKGKVSKDIWSHSNLFANAWQRFQSRTKEQHCKTIQTLWVWCPQGQSNCQKDEALHHAEKVPLMNPPMCTHRLSCPVVLCPSVCGRITWICILYKILGISLCLCLVCTQPKFCSKQHMCLLSQKWECTKSAATFLNPCSFSTKWFKLTKPKISW